jgi:hypothetical protein
MTSRLGTTIYVFDPSGNRRETFGGYIAYQMDPDCRATKWTQDQIGPAVFYSSHGSAGYLPGGRGFFTDEKANAASSPLQEGAREARIERCHPLGGEQRNGAGGPGRSGLVKP